VVSGAAEWDCGPFSGTESGERTAASDVRWVEFGVAEDGMSFSGEPFPMRWDVNGMGKSVAWCESGYGPDDEKRRLKTFRLDLDQLTSQSKRNFRSIWIS